MAISDGYDRDQARECIQCLRCIGGVLRLRRSCLDHDVLGVLLELAGGMLFCASRDGCLEGYLDLRRIVGPKDWSWLERGPLVRMLMFPQLETDVNAFMMAAALKTITPTRVDLSSDGATTMAVGAKQPMTKASITARAVIPAVWQAMQGARSGAIMAVGNYIEAAKQDLACCATDLEAEAVRGRWVCKYAADAVAEFAVSHASDWWPQHKAAAITGILKGTLSRAAKDGQIKTNGREGREQRIDPLSLYELLRRREVRESEAAKSEPAMDEEPTQPPNIEDESENAELETPEQSKLIPAKINDSKLAPERNPAVQGCSCRSCGEWYDKQPKKCPKCHRSTFEPAKRRV